MLYVRNISWFQGMTLDKLGQEDIAAVIKLEGNLYPIDRIVLSNSLNYPMWLWRGVYEYRVIK